jgi:hypothetical protein
MIDRCGPVVAVLLLAACGEQGGPDTSGAGSNSGGSGGAAAGSTASGGAGAGNGGAAGGTSGSATGGTSGQGGGSGPLTGEQLRDATHDECFAMCTKANQVCPDYKISDCLLTCQGQADDAFASEACASELYEALQCINALENGKIACDPNGVVFNGCEAEQAAYSGC